MLESSDFQTFVSQEILRSSPDSFDSYAWIILRPNFRILNHPMNFGKFSCQ